MTSSTRAPAAFRQGVVRSAPLALLLVLALLLAVVPAAPAAASRTNAVELAAAEGDDAIAAAIAFSRETFPPDTARVALLGRADLFADSLSAGSLQDGRPLLLTQGDVLSPRTAAELARLGTTRVLVLGGAGAIAPAVEAQLRAAGIEPRRLSGPTRLETATAIAAETPEATRVLLSRAFGQGSQAFADSLAAGALSADEGRPILLSQSSTLSDTTRAYLDANPRIRMIDIVGGPGAISPGVEEELRILGYTVRRVAGANRFATAVAIATARGFATAAEAEQVILVDGGAFAAGFAGAANAAASDAPILLASGITLPVETRDYLAAGGPGTRLVCGQVAPQACDAAAEALGQVTRSVVSIPEDTLLAGTPVAGTISGRRYVRQLAVNGCDLVDQVVSTDGDAFSLLPPASPGSCALQFSITHTDGNTTTQAVPLTITAPLGLPDRVTRTAAPELRRVDVVSSGRDDLTLRYTFDAKVVSTTAARFAVHAFDGTVRTATEAVIDADAPRTVLAAFDLRPVTLVTTAAPLEVRDLTTAGVAADAVRDGLGRRGIQGAYPLRDVILPGGVTSAPDLRSVSVNAAAGRATFTFDAPAHAVGAVVPDAEPGSGAGSGAGGADGGGAGSGAAPARDGGAAAVPAVATTRFRLLGADGVERESRGVVGGHGTGTLVVDFGAIDGIELVRGIAQTDAVSAVPRAGTVAGDSSDDRTTNPLQTTALGGDGQTADQPNLAGVTLLPATDQVRFTFDRVVGPSTPAGADFRVFEAGAAQSSAIRAAVDGDVVIATFAPGAVNPLVVGAAVAGAAVRGDDTVPASANGPAQVAVASTVRAASTAGPSLIGVSIGAAGAGTTPVTFTFDVRVDAGSVDGAGFALFDAGGARLLSATSVLAPTQRGTDPATVIVLFSNADARAAVMAGVDQGAVTLDGGRFAAVGHSVPR